MSLSNIITINGIIELNGIQYKDPKVYISKSLIPYKDDIIVLQKDNTYTAEPYNNHPEESIIGVVVSVVNS